MDVIDLKSESSAGFLIFGIVTILATFHCDGTTDCIINKLYKGASGIASSGANNLKNHAGIPSGPAAVGLSFSKIL